MGAGGIEAGMKAVDGECQHHLLEEAHLGLTVPPSPCFTIRILASLLGRQVGDPDADTGADSEEQGTEHVPTLLPSAEPPESCAKLITLCRASRAAY